MDRIFKVDFYPHEWLSDTSKLTPDERGNFIQICALIYAHRGPIDYNEKWLAGLCGCSTRLLRKTVDNLVDKKFLELLENNKLTQKRAESELRVKRELLESSSKGGRTSAERRRKSGENNDMDSSPLDEALGSTHPTPSQESNNPKIAPTAARDGFLKNGGGMSAASGPTPKPGARSIRFDVDQNDRARSKAKALARDRNRDYDALVREFDAWVADVGPRDNPVGSFLSFIEKKGKL